MKIIFLDIDGVLATDAQFYMNRHNFHKNNPIAKDLRIPYPFDKKCVKVLNDILDATGAEIVLSSDWREHFSLGELDTIFKFNGVNKSPIDITSTEIVSFGNITMNRAYQIGLYITENDVDSYVVIDDLPVGKYMQITNDDDKFVLTKESEGIKQLGVKSKILKILS